MKNRLEANVKAALPSWDRIAGNWKQFVGKARERWGELTDDDMEVIAGRRELLVGKIQERYGIITDQAERQVAAWMNELGEGDTPKARKPVPSKH
jgi:uncharacterized protein YjbJ (UPF0337 family)